MKVSYRIFWSVLVLVLMPWASMAKSDQSKKSRGLFGHLGDRFMAKTLVVPKRCEKDDLSIAQAFGRLSWAKKCYAESWPYPEKAIIANLLDGLKLPQKEADPRPYYPTYAKLDRNGQLDRRYKTIKDGKVVEREFVAPTDPDAPCFMPEGFRLAAVCLSSCYMPTELVWVEGGWAPVGELTLENNPKIMAVGSGSNMGDLHFEPTSVEYYISSLEDVWHDILVIQTLSGKTLRVTPNHPLLKADGTLAQAADLVAGDLLVQANSESDSIINIYGMKHFGKVYNVTLNSSEPENNLIVAQGLVNGTAFYQNEGLSYLNQVVFRTSLPDELLEEEVKQ